MIEIIAMDDQSFMTSEHLGFKMFCGVLNPHFQVVGRKTVRNDVLKNYESSKHFIKSILCQKGNGMKNLTTDLWSSLVAAGFMCITIHYINLHWQLIHFLLSFTELPQPHNSVNISTEMVAVITNYDLDVLSVTLDNASVNDAAMRDFAGRLDDQNILLAVSGELSHNRCWLLS